MEIVLVVVDNVDVDKKFEPLLIQVVVVVVVITAVSQVGQLIMMVVEVVVVVVSMDDLYRQRILNSFFVLNLGGLFLSWLLSLLEQMELLLVLVVFEL